MTAPHLIQRLTQLFLRFNRRLMFVVRDIPHELRVTESHVLMEIGYAPDIIARRLSELLGVEKSVISRVVERLEAQGLVTRSSGSEDQREKSLRLTKKGRLVMQRDIEARNRMAAECASPLQDLDLEEFNRHLNRLADGLQAEAIPLREGDHPTKIAIRRLTRSMGFLGSNAVESGLPIDELQVISLVGERPGLHFTDLQQQLAYDQSPLSQLVTRLTKRGALSKELNRLDRRQVQLTLTSAGETLLQNALAGAQGLLTRGTRAFSDYELARFVALLEHFLPDGIRVELHGRVVTLPLLRPEEVAHARAFALESLVATGRHHSAPEAIVSSRSVTCGVFENGVLRGVAEARRRKKQWEISLFVVSHDPTTPSLPKELAAGTLRALANKRSVRTVQIPLTVLSEEILGSLPFKRQRTPEGHIISL